MPDRFWSGLAVGIFTSIVGGLLIEPIKQWWARTQSKQRVAVTESTRAQYRQVVSYHDHPELFSQLLSHTVLLFARTCCRLGTAAAIVFFLRVLKGAGPVPNYLYMGLCCFGMAEFQAVGTEVRNVVQLYGRVWHFEEYKKKLPGEVTKDSL